MRIEHGEGITPDLIARARDLNVIVVQNPTHLAMPELMAKRNGIERMNQLQPLGSLLDAGIPLAIGSDGPANPYLRTSESKRSGSLPSKSRRIRR